MERSPHQPGCAGQVKFSKAEAQVRRESWCWYQQGGCTDGLSTQPCPAHIHLHLSPTAPASRSTRRWKMRNASHCSWAKLCYCKERQRALKALFRTWAGLGRARARPGMGWHGKIPSPTLQPEAAWPRLGALPLAQVAESCKPCQQLSLLRRSCANQLSTRNLCPCELIIFSLWIRAGLRRYYIGISKGISSHFGSSQIFRRAQHNA